MPHEITPERTTTNAPPLLTRVLTAIGTQANSDMLRGQPDRAEVLLRWAVALSDWAPAGAGRVQGRVRALTQLGDFLRLRGRYAEAEPALQEALAKAEECLNPADPSLVPPLNALGIVYKYTGQFDRAEQVYRRALMLAKAQPSPDLSQLA